MNDTHNRNEGVADRTASEVSESSGADGLFIHGLLREWRRGGDAAVDEHLVTRIMRATGPAAGHRAKLWTPLALAAAALVACGVWWWTRAPGIGAALAQVTSVSPGVQYRTPDRVGPKDLQSGDIIQSGAMVSTPGGGKANLKYIARDITLELSESSQLELTDANSGRLLEGRVQARASGFPKGTRFVLSTPHAEAVVMGTHFILETKGARTGLAVLKGHVDLVAANQRRSVPALFASEAVDGLAPSPPKLLSRDVFLRFAPEYRSFDQLREALKVPELLPGPVVNSLKSIEDMEWREEEGRQVNPDDYVSPISAGQVRVRNADRQNMHMRLKQELPARSYRVEMEFRVRPIDRRTPPGFGSMLLNTTDENEHMLFEGRHSIGDRWHRHQTDVIYSSDPAGRPVADMMLFLDGQPTRWVRYRGRLTSWYAGASLRQGTVEIRKWTVRELAAGER